MHSDEIISLKMSNLQWSSSIVVDPLHMGAVVAVFRARENDVTLERGDCHHIRISF